MRSHIKEINVADIADDALLKKKKNHSYVLISP